MRDGADLGGDRGIERAHAKDAKCHVSARQGFTQSLGEIVTMPSPTDQATVDEDQFH